MKERSHERLWSLFLCVFISLSGQFPTTTAATAAAATAAAPTMVYPNFARTNIGMDFPEPTSTDAGDVGPNVYVDVLVDAPGDVADDTVVDLAVGHGVEETAKGEDGKKSIVSKTVVQLKVNRPIKKTGGRSRPRSISSPENRAINVKGTNVSTEDVKHLLNQQSSESSDSGSAIMVWVGCVVGFLCLLCVAVVLVLIIVWKRKSSGSQELTQYSSPKRRDEDFDDPTSQYMTLNDLKVEYHLPDENFVKDSLDIYWTQKGLNKQVKAMPECGYEVPVSPLFLSQPIGTDILREKNDTLKTRRARQPLPTSTTSDVGPISTTYIQMEDVMDYGPAYSSPKEGLEPSDENVYFQPIQKPVHTFDSTDEKIDAILRSKSDTLKTRRARQPLPASTTSDVGPISTTYIQLEDVKDSGADYNFPQKGNGPAVEDVYLQLLNEQVQSSESTGQDKEGSDDIYLEPVIRSPPTTTITAPSTPGTVAPAIPIPTIPPIPALTTPTFPSPTTPTTPTIPSPTTPTTPNFPAPTTPGSGPKKGDRQCDDEDVYLQLVNESVYSLVSADFDEENGAAEGNSYLQVSEEPVGPTH